MESPVPDCRRDCEECSADSEWDEPEPAVGQMRSAAVCRIGTNADAKTRRKLLDRLVEARAREQAIHHCRDGQKNEPPGSRAHDSVATPSWAAPGLACLPVLR